MTDSQSPLNHESDVVELSAAERARRERRAQLLAAARRLFLQRGFAATPVSAIVHEAGVAQGTFYLYFKSKDAVLGHLRAEVLADYMASFAVPDDAAEDSPADQRLVAALSRVRDVVVRQQAMTRVLRQASSTQEIDAIWIQGRTSLAEPLARLLEDGQHDGSWSIDDPTMTAHLTLALLDDLLYEALEYGDPGPLDRTFTAAVRFLLNALRVPSARVDQLAPNPS